VRTLSEAAVVFNQVTKEFTVKKSAFSYRHVRAVDGVSFVLHPGENLAIVGESGSGKSTIGRLLLRLYDHDAGDIILFGEDIRRMVKERTRNFRQTVQMLFQNPLGSFNPMLTMGQSLREPLQLRTGMTAKDKREEVRSFLEQVGLGPEFIRKRPGEMSGGELQRAGLARALAPKPKVVFLDEPTSALDMSVRGQIINLIQGVQEDQDLALLYVTHDLRLVQQVADRVIVTYLGQILEETSQEELFTDPLHPYTRSLLAATRLGHESQPVEVMEGEVVQSQSEVEGCRLYSRCPLATEECRSPQELLSVNAQHKVRCWRVREESGGVS